MTFFMPYNLTHLRAYLEDTTAAEIACLLDELLYDLVLSAEYLQSYENFPDRYLTLLELRDQFAKMDKNLQAVWK